MAQSGLSKKLLIKPGCRVVILNAPPDYIAPLGELPDGVILSHHAEGYADVVHLFAYNKWMSDE
ncbi:MAG: hypothetical protein U0350_27220 [Caldilineaceae bacterium]